MKQCARCKKWKDEEEFNWRWQDRGVLQSICRECQHDQSRQHYETHKENVKAKAAETKREAIERAQRYIYEYLSNTRCADCGEYGKCEVVCFNCHMRLDNERRSGGRFRRFWPKFPWEE